MAGCNGPCKCPTFREHALGVRIAGAALPTRGSVEVRRNTAMEDRWSRENDAYKRLASQGYELPHLDGADKIEQQATTEIELKHGRLYGDNAKLMEKVDSGDLL